MLSAKILALGPSFCARLSGLAGRASKRTSLTSFTFPRVSTFPKWPRIGVKSSP
jgi:hypothetical protein